MNDDVMIGLIKFIAPEYSKDFENNKLFFNTLSTFHNIRHNQIGDKLEGVISNKFGDDNEREGLTMYYQVEDEAKVNSVQIDTATVKFTPELVNNIYINCFSKLMLSDLEIHQGNVLKIKQSYIDQLVGIHDNRNIYVSIGGYKDRFLEKLINYSKTNKLKMKGNVVNYFENEHPMFNKIENMKKLLIRDCINGCFYKHIKYQNQNEYRLLFIGLNDNIIKIKNMREDWFKVDSLDDIKVVIGTEEEVENYLK